MVPKFLVWHGNPSLSTDSAYVPDQPLACRWVPHKDPGHDALHYRRVVDSLTAALEQIVFDAYRLRRAIPEPIDLYTGALCCQKTVEPYHPVWVLRQFGYCQGIPLMPMTPLREERGREGGRAYKIVFRFVGSYWADWSNHVVVDLGWVAPQGKVKVL